VLALNEIQTSNIRFDISVTGNGRKIKGMGARGIFGEERGEGSARGGTPADGIFSDYLALQFGGIVSSVKQALVCSGMGVGEGVTVVGSEEIMCDELVAEAGRGEEVPHPLTVFRLEMMRTTV